MIGHDCSSRLLPDHYYNAAPPLLLHCTAQPCQSRAGVKQWTGVSQLSSSSFAAQSSSCLILLFLLLSPIRFWVWGCWQHIFQDPYALPSFQRAWFTSNTNRHVYCSYKSRGICAYHIFCTPLHFEACKLYVKKCINLQQNSVSQH